MFQDDLPGQSLLDLVFARLNLIETAYFGIRYLDNENQTVIIYNLKKKIKFYGTINYIFFFITQQ